MNFIVENKPLSKGAKYQTPNRIVIHAMGEYIKTDDGPKHAYDFLKSIGLSVHALICPSGVVIRCREDNQGAYHAKNYNKNSLGVEFLVKGTYTYSSFLKAIDNYYLTFDQHVAGVELLRQWCSYYDIKSIDMHSQLALRKFDPGRGFPIEQFLIDVKRG